MKCNNIVIFPVYFFPVGKSASGKQVENHSHCPEQEEGILQSSLSVGKGTICFRASFPLLLL